MNRLRIFVLVAASFACAGCKNDGPKLVDVEGVVTFQGEPVPNLTIHFVPETGRPSWGKSDAQGRFKLSYDPENSGAEVGQHKVWVQFRPASPDEEENFPQALAKMGKARQEMLKKYGDRMNPQYEVEINRDTRKVEIKLE